MMKNFTNTTRIWSLFALIFTASMMLSASCDPQDAITTIKLNKSSVVLPNGTTYELFATVTATDPANGIITWKSSNTAIATVDSEGKVTTKASSGTTVITATTADGKEAKCDVNVLTKSSFSIYNPTRNSNALSTEEIASSFTYRMNSNWSKADGIVWTASSNIVRLTTTKNSAGDFLTTVNIDDINNYGTITLKAEYTYSDNTKVSSSITLKILSLRFYCISTDSWHFGGSTPTLASNSYGYWDFNIAAYPNTTPTYAATWTASGNEGILSVHDSNKRARLSLYGWGFAAVQISANNIALSSGQTINMYFSVR